MDIQNIIIQKIDLPQFIKDYAHVELVRKGNGWRCKCPIHENSVNPEAMYVDDRGGYYCFACNSGGNVINFLSDYEHISYSAATERLASMLNINLKDDAEYQDQKRLEDKFNGYKKRGLAGVDNVKQYLTEKRGFTEETIQTFELGMWDGKMTIPLLDANGRTVGMAVRQFDAKPKYMNSRNNLLYDKSEFLFGLDKARRLIKNTVYVVEGYMDAISGYQMGIPTVAYCSNELHRDQIRMLNNYLRRDTTVVICPDNDEAGKKRIPRVRDYFKAISPSRQVRVVLMPDGYKDMNDLLLAGTDAQTLPTEHIDKYVARLIIEACKTIEEEYQRAEEYLKTVKSEMIRLDIIKYLAERWNKDVEDLKKYFNTVGEDSNDILSEASDITGCINDLRKIYSIGGYKTHFQQIDNCIRKVEKKQVVVIGAYSGVGKALTLDSRLATPNGFIRMGDVKIGDTVFDENGLPTTVTHIFPQGEKDVYRVTFRDGTFVDCCEDHLWKFNTLTSIHRNKPWKVAPLKDIMKKYKLMRGSNDQQGYNLFIPVAKPVQYEEKDHIISPYSLGLLLGDGGFSTQQLTFTNTEDDVRERLISETGVYGEWRVHTGQSIQLCFCGGRDNKMVSYIRTTFQGCKSHDKFIPPEYLFDSESNRLSLVRGLMDTDGHVDERGISSFYTGSPRLAEGFRALVESLGSRCFVRKYRREESDYPEYIVSIWGPSGKWFSSKKHKVQWENRRRTSRTIDRDRMAIVSIDKLNEKQEMQCITVSSQSHTYLCNDYIVTHNTDFAIEYMLRAICQDNMRVAFFSLEMPKGKLIERCLAKLIKCSTPEVEGYIASNDTAVQKVIAKLQNRLVVFDGNDYSMGDIQKRIELVNTKNILGGPIDMVFVDYFGYMKGTSEFEGASAAATKMKAVAKENDLIFVMLSQLNRGGNPYGEPNMQQLKLTGDLEASADVIMLLWRPGKDPNLSLEEKDQLENVTRIKIDKTRDGMYGNPVSEYYYNKATSRLEEKYLE